jgi:hypothetical protein
MADFKKVRNNKSATVQLADGTSKSLEPGEPVEVDQLSDNLKEKLEAGDEYLDKLFEDASEEDVEKWKAGRRPEPSKDFDRMQQLEGVVLPAPGEEAQVEAAPAEEEQPRRRRRRSEEGESEEE